MTLAAGPAGKAKISVKAKGAALPALSLPLQEPVTVELVNGTAVSCWGAIYSAPPVTASSSKWKDKSD